MNKLTKQNSKLSILFAERQYEQVYRRMCAAMVHDHQEMERLTPFYSYYESVMVLCHKMNEHEIGV